MDSNTDQRPGYAAEGGDVGDETTLRKQVEEVLGRIRWALNEDGGDIEVLEARDGVVKVRFLGACHG